MAGRVNQAGREVIDANKYSKVRANQLGREVIDANKYSKVRANQLGREVIYVQVVTLSAIAPPVGCQCI